MKKMTLISFTGLFWKQDTKEERRPETAMKLAGKEIWKKTNL